MKEKKPRPTMARFTTEECKVILMAMNYSKNREVFIHEGTEVVSRAYGVMAKLKYRIDEENKKKNKILLETYYGDIV